MKPIPTDIQHQMRSLGIHVPTSGLVTTFYRLQIQKETFYAKLYGRVFKRNSFTIRYSHNGFIYFGSILYFLALQSTTVAVVNRLSVSSSNPFAVHVHHINVVHASPTLDVVRISSIIEKCFSICTGQVLYVARFHSKFIKD